MTDQLPQAAEVIALVRKCRFAGFFERFAGVLAGQGKQALNNAMPLDASYGNHRLGPCMGLRTDRTSLTKQVRDALLKAVDLGLMDMIDRRAEAAMLMPGMNRDLLMLVIEDPHGAAVPSGPDLPPEILRRNGVVGPGNLHVPISANLPPGLLEVLKATRWQWQKLLLFEFMKDSQYLPLGRPMNPEISGLLLPVEQELILLGEARELPPLESVVLDIGNAAFDLALVPRCPRLGRQDDRAIVSAELSELRIELGVEPIGLDDGRLEVVDDKRVRNATEVLEGILKAADEVIG